MIRAGIRMILNSDPEIQVVGEAADGRAAVEAARAHAADVVLLDIQMPLLDGLSALPELRRAVPEARVIILTTFGERENVLRALEHGGAGFLLKDTAPAELIGAVRATAAGDAYLSPAATRHVVERLARGREAARAEEARGRVAALSEKERGVLALLGEGLSNADAGKRLHMSEGTVKTYVSRILAKLDCENRVQAALLARDAGL
ncbi:LuxR family transcriptional regulator [Streptomyces sp. NRRL F-6491]|nr:LuxR family transcriptional regulator [Streptomyces sp. NRRL F-6491]KOX52746.1 LuxR family transcriptional regulator [Streptomyces sp. NRRL F-6492]